MAATTREFTPARGGATAPLGYRGGAFRSPPSLEQTRRLTAPTVLGEAVASFLLVFLGTASVVAYAQAAAPGKPDLTGIALCWGFAVLAVVYAFGHVSGAHVNPSVTLGLAVTRRFPWSAVPAYLGAQFTGGILASLVVLAIFGSHARDAPLGLGLSAPGAGYGAGPCSSPRRSSRSSCSTWSWPRRPTTGPSRPRWASASG